MLNVCILIVNATIIYIVRVQFDPLTKNDSDSSPISSSQ